MADVEITALSITELIRRKVEIDNHVAQCCRATDGTCSRLVDLGEIDYLLGKDEDRGSAVERGGQPDGD